jgi:hypothetical protein
MLAGRGAIALVWFFVLLAAGWITGVAGALGCAENVNPATTRGSVCTTAGLSDFGSGAWLLFTCGAALSFVLATIAFQQVRSRPSLVGGALLGALVALDTVLLVLVTS